MYFRYTHFVRYTHTRIVHVYEKPARRVDLQMTSFNLHVADNLFVRFPGSKPSHRPFNPLRAIPQTHTVGVFSPSTTHVVFTPSNPLYIPSESIHWRNNTPPFYRS